MSAVEHKRIWSLNQANNIAWQTYKLVEKAGAINFQHLSTMYTMLKLTILVME